MNPVSPIAKAIVALIIPIVIKLLGQVGVEDLDITALQTVLLAAVAAVGVYVVPNRPA